MPLHQQSTGGTDEILHIFELSILILDKIKQIKINFLINNHYSTYVTM